MIDKYSGAKLWAVYSGNKELQAFHTRGEAELYAKFFMRRVPGSTVEVVWIGG